MERFFISLNTIKIVSFFLLLTFILSLVHAVSVNADAVSGTDKTPGIANLTERWLRYRAVAACYGAGDVGKNNVDEISEGTWLKSGTFDNVTTIGYLNDDGKVSCGDGDMISNSLKTIGFSDNKQAFCSMSTAERGGKKGYQNCLSGNGDFDMDGSKSDQVSAFGASVNANIADHAQFPFETNNAQTKKILYWVGLQSLKKFCGAKQGSVANASNSNDISNSKKTVLVTEVDLSTGKPVNYGYTMSEDQDHPVAGIYAQTQRNLNETGTYTCAGLAKLTRDNADAFSRFIQNYNKAEPEDAAKTKQLGGDDGAGDTPQENSCNIDGVGWIVCPAMQFLGDINDKAFDFISGNFLNIQADLVNRASPTFTAWKTFRDIANGLFVIAFIVIIYSQLTGAGITNYGIKRMLPRIIAAAILVNVSYYLCQAAVDLSNIVGSAIYDLLIKLVPVATPGGDQTYGTWASAMKAVLLAGIGIGLVALVILGPTVLIAFAIIVLILVARKALVVMLIVLAPIAFVAYLLPNTESLFKKWWKAFSTVLLVYPTIAVIFGASKLASGILVNVAAKASDSTLAIIALAVAAIPLFAVPTALKGSLAAAGTIGARLSGAADRMQSKGTGRAKKIAGDTAKRYGNDFESRMAARGGAIGAVGGFRTRRNFRRKSQESETARRQDDALAEHVIANRSGNYTTRQQATAVSQQDKAFQEEVSAATILQKNENHQDRLDAARTGKLNGKTMSEAERTAAINYSMSNGNFKERSQVLSGVGSMEGQEKALQSLSEGYYKTGMNGVYGSQLGDTIAQGGLKGSGNNIEEQLNEAALNNIKAGKLKAETLVKDGHGAQYIADIIEAGKLSKELSAEQIANAKEAASIAGSSPALAGQRNAQVQIGIDKINGL